MKLGVAIKRKSQKYLLVSGDILFISLSIFLAYVITFFFFEQRALRLSHILNRISPWIGILVLYIFIFYVTDLYEPGKIKDTFRSTIIMAISVLGVSFISSGVLFFFSKYIIGRRVIIIHAPFVIFLLLLWRVIFINTFLKRDSFIRLALIGTKEVILNFINEFSHLGLTEFQVSQICITDMDRKGKIFLNKHFSQSISVYKNVDDLLENENFDLLAFDYTQGEMSKREIHQILESRFKGKFVYDFPSFYQELTGKVPLNYIDSRWLLSKEELQGRVSNLYMRIKRLLDILFSAIFLLMTFPLWIIIALAIKLDSKGNVFFRQERLGIMRRPFVCYKFRSMKMGAEDETGPQWSRTDDPRITRVGKALRKMRLDELPQLWNILKGDMSFVGTRPIREYFADKLAEMIPYYDLRFLVKPGLTGWAQVNHGYSGSEEDQFEKFQYELFYIKKMSIFLDLFIIFKTSKTVIKRKGK